MKYREALWKGFRQLEGNNEINLTLITTIFQQIKNTTAGLRPPQALVVIKQGQSEFITGEVVYTPPGGEGVMEKYMDNLIEYLNDDERYLTDPLLKMCVAHYQFEAYLAQVLPNCLAHAKTCARA